MGKRQGSGLGRSEKKRRGGPAGSPGSDRLLLKTGAQYMSPWPCGMGGSGFFSSGSSETRASVVRSRPATEAAFCRAVRVTLAGSMMPAAVRSSRAPVSALSPVAVLLAGLHLLHHHRAFDSGIGGDLSKRLLQRPHDDPDTDLFIFLELELFQGRNPLEERNRLHPERCLPPQRPG